LPQSEKCGTERVKQELLIREYVPYLCRFVTWVVMSMVYVSVLAIHAFKRSVVAQRLILFKPLTKYIDGKYRR